MSKLKYNLFPMLYSDGDSSSRHWLWLGSRFNIYQYLDPVSGECWTFLKGQLYLQSFLTEEKRASFDEYKNVFFLVWGHYNLPSQFFLFCSFKPSNPIIFRFDNLYNQIRNPWYNQIRDPLYNQIRGPLYNVQPSPGRLVQCSTESGTPYTTESGTPCTTESGTPCTMYNQIRFHLYNV